jgi:hypothetical protein
MLKAISGGAAAAVLPRLATAAEGDQAAEKLPPVRTITHGPKHHWFGYYDKLEFDPTDRYVLGMEVDFQHRSPKPDDVIRVGMIDLADGDRWIELGTSTAWCWQQGCMLQWRPGCQSEILWNDRQDGRYVCHILDVKTGKKRTIGHPIYAVSPDGQWAIAPDFRRLADTRPGYGYNGIPDPNRDVPAPTDAGLFRIDLNTGEQKLLLSFADIARIPYPHRDLSGAKHWFNHLLVNTDGSRFTFLHRWMFPGEKWRETRMITANPDGSEVRVLQDSGLMSHFIWRDPQHILGYSKATRDGKAGFFVYRDTPEPAVEEIRGMESCDGHCTYLPGNEWILCDTYPDKNRNQNVYLCHVATGRRVWLGHFLLPKEYTGEWRCDTHPRLSRNGRTVAIDTPHGDEGRQLHLIDIGGIV